MGTNRGKQGLEQASKKDELPAMDIALAEALWRLDKLPVQALEDLAVTALTQGHDGHALRELAWPHASWGDVGDLFARALSEMGRPPIDRAGAIACLIRHRAADIVEGRVPPFEGARRLFYAVWWDIDNLDDYKSITELLQWGNVYEDDPERCDEFSAKILQRARQLMEHDPVALSRSHPDDCEPETAQTGTLTADMCILLVNDVEPTFQLAWRSSLETWGPDARPGLSMYLAEFARHTGDLLLQGETDRVRAILGQIERLLEAGDTEVQNAAATCFLEGLLHRTDLPASAYAPWLGPHSIAYLRTWDEFNGVRTEALWNEANRQ
jgi:hypothetical protein